MMDSYQQSVEGTNRQSTVVNNEKEAAHEQQTAFSYSRLLKIDGFRWLAAISIVLLFLLLCSCGDEGLIDPHGQTKLSPSDSTGTLQAIDFPTDTGSAWTYINVDTEMEFTIRVQGTRDISGTTHRQMAISEIIFVEESEELAIDHLAANAYYLRFFETDFLEVNVPILATYFTKTPHALIESAYDAFISPLPNPIFHQKHFPQRRLWDFPLEVGKEWVVFEKTAGTPVSATRFVAEKDVQITVPAGTYSTYVVYEEVVYGVSDDPSIRLISPPAVYWVAPSVGVVQYRFSRYRATDTFQTQTFALKSVHLPGPHTD